MSTVRVRRIGRVSLPYVDLKGVALAFVADVAEENIRAIGTGKGGAGNMLPALESSTIRRKGHGRQIEDSGRVRRAIGISGRTAAVYTSSPPKGKGKANKVAEYLVLGTGKYAKKQFQFFGCTGKTMALFVENVVNRIAGAWGARVDMGSMASLRRMANRPWIDPGVKKEIVITTTRAGLAG